MSGRVSQSRASRPGKKATANKRTLCPELLEPRMMLSGVTLPAAASAAAVHAPTVAQAVSVNGNAAVTGKTAAISVLGSDSAGASALRYTWSVTTLPAGGNVTFAANGSNAADNTVATFNEAGSYGLEATITDPSGLSVTSSATAVVSATLSSIRLTDVTSHSVISATTPYAVNAASETIAAQGLDQFGNVMSTQPAWSWSATSLPSGAASPRFAAGSSGETITFAKAGNYGIAVKGTSGGVSLSGTATLAVNPVLSAITFASGNSMVVNGTSVQIVVSQFLDQFQNPLATQPTLGWSAGIPGAARMPTFTIGTKSLAVAFGTAGTYTFKATATDATGHSASQSVTVLVDQVATSIASGLASTVTIAGTSEQLSDPAVLDQFGNALATQPAYTWSASTLPSGAAAPTFATSGSTTTVKFSKAGSYALRAYVSTASSLALSTTVIVNQTLSSISVSPTSASIKAGATQQFTAQAFDQFNNLLATQPTLAWSASAGTISSGGLFTAPSTSGSASVTAKSGSISGSASLTVTANSNSTLGLNDPTLAALVQSLDTRDGSINRADMMQILRSVATSGTLSATDFADLKTLLGSSDATKLDIPGYVEVLASDVVDGNAANAHYLGQTLGNLAAGSSTTQLDDLVNKWFMGTDLPNPGSSVLPSQYVTYQSVSGSLFPHAPTITDEHQGELGDCYFISSLGTIASSNPAAIENMIINNGDGTYTVRFYTGTYGGSSNSDGSYNDGFASGTGTADYVTVNSMLPTYGGTLAFADYGASPTNANNPLWIPLLEKAYAQWNETGNEGRNGTNTYAGIEGGWMATVDAQVLGHNATDYSMAANYQQDMINALNSGEAVTIGTIGSSNNSDTLPYGLYGSHAYGVTGYNASSNTFTLYNPWGFDQPTSALTWADLQATTSGFVVANPSGTTPLGGGQAKSAAVQAAPLVNLAASAVAGAPASGLSGNSASDLQFSPSVLADANSAGLALAGTSVSVTNDATRVLFDRLGTGSEPLPLSHFHGDAQTSDSLAALSVDELFADTVGTAENAFAD